MKVLTKTGFKETVADGEASEVLLGEINYARGLTPQSSAHGYIPADTTISLIPGAGATARIEYSLSTTANVVADEAVWHAWAKGDVTATTVDALVGQVTALRMLTTGGASVWEVR